MKEQVSKYFGFLIFMPIIMIMISTQYLQAQSLEMNAVELLKSEGFEEIRVIEQGPEIICTIERGLFRSPDADFHKALYLLKSVFISNSQFRIILSEQGQAVYELMVGAKEVTNILPDSTKLKNPEQNIEINYADLNFFNSIKKESAQRPVHSGITVVIYPQITIQNMYFDHIYEKQINLAPALNYSAWQGMLLTGQVIFPLINELKYIDNFIRPGFVTFRQNIKLPQLNELKLTIGNFSNNRYGADLKWKKQFQNSRWRLGANLGITGRSIFYDRYWNHSSLNRFIWNVKTSYYLPIYQMQADLLAGQFLAGDKGFRMDFYRHFGEVTIGVYAAYTGHNPNGGFHFAVPLDPFNRRHKNRIRIMLPSYFDMEYSARNEFVYDRYYETSPDENRSEQDLTPEYIKNQFINTKTQK